MKTIPIKDRLREVVCYAMVDDEDYNVVVAHVWHRKRSAKDRTMYLATNTPRGTPLERQLVCTG